MKGIKYEEDMFFGATPKIFDFARQLRAHLTSSEQKIWQLLSKKQLGVKFRRQHPLSCYVADFYCHELKLVIEIDGESHDGSNQKEYDIGRTEELQRFGIKVIRFTNEEVYADIKKIERKISEVVRMLTRTPDP